ncbi:MAG: FAD binding domain-containing protein [Pseudomonadota bacterium]
MRPAPFELVSPKSTEEALSLLASGGVPIAGGQSLVQAMRLRERTPSVVVDIGAIPSLDAEINYQGDCLTIGAKVTHQQLAANQLVGQDFPWLAEAAYRIGDQQVRNHGTTIGNLCWADPRANMAVALLASDAEVEFLNAVSPAPETMPISEFFSGFQQPNAQAQLVTAVKVKRNNGSLGVYSEFSRQRQDLAVVSASVLNHKDNWAVALGGMAQTPIRVAKIEERLDSIRTIADLKRILETLQEVNPIEDSYGSRDFKVHTAATLIARAFQRLSYDRSGATK